MYATYMGRQTKVLDLQEQVPQVVLCGFWELNLDPLEEQAALVTAELLPQPYSPNCLLLF